MLNRCNLCDGIIRGGKCMDCGMPDQSKRYDLNENMSKREKRETFEKTMNHSTSTYSETSKKKSNKRGIPTQIPVELQEGLEKSEDMLKRVGLDFDGENKEKKRGSVIKVIVFVFAIFQIVIPLLFSLLGAASNVIGDAVSDVTELSMIPDNSEWGIDIKEILSESPLNLGEEDLWYSYNYGEDEIVLRELATTGSQVDMVLGNGMYEVGVHLPEGTYTMTCMKPCTLTATDYENYRYIYNYLDEDKVGDTFTKVDFYNGTIIGIDDGEMQFVSSNGDEGTMYGVQNEAPKTVAVTERLMVGEDLEPGFYDVVMGEGDYGYFMASNPGEELPLDEDGQLDTYNYEADYLYRMYLHYGPWDIEEGTVVNCEQHVYLPEGAQIGTSTEKNTISLVESELIPPESSYENWLNEERY